MDETSCTYKVDSDSRHDEDRDSDSDGEIFEDVDSTTEPKHFTTPENCKDAKSFEPANSRQAENTILHTTPSVSRFSLPKNFVSRETVSVNLKRLKLEQNVCQQYAALKQKADGITEMITLTSDRAKNSIQENFQEEFDSIHAYTKANEDQKNKASELSERIDELMRLPLLDRLKERRKLCGDFIQFKNNFHVKDIHLKNMTHVQPEMMPGKFPLWKIMKKHSGNFKRLFNKSLTVLGSGTTYCELREHNFKFIMKKVRDFEDCSAGDNRKPKYHLGVWCSITDNSPLPVDTYIKVTLVNLNSDEDNISREGQFKFEMCGQGHGWKKFCPWDIILEDEMGFAKFGNVFFDIDIGIPLITTTEYLLKCS